MARLDRLGRDRKTSRSSRRAWAGSSRTRCSRPSPLRRLRIWSSSARSRPAGRQRPHSAVRSLGGRLLIPTRAGPGGGLSARCSRASDESCTPGSRAPWRLFPGDGVELAARVAGPPLHGGGQDRTRGRALAEGGTTRQGRLREREAIAHLGRCLDGDRGTADDDSRRPGPHLDLDRHELERGSCSAIWRASQAISERPIAVRAGPGDRFRTADAAPGSSASGTGPGPPSVTAPGSPSTSTGAGPQTLRVRRSARLWPGDVPADRRAALPGVPGRYGRLAGQRCLRPACPPVPAQRARQGRAHRDRSLGWRAGNRRSGYRAAPISCSSSPTPSRASSPSWSRSAARRDRPGQFFSEEYLS